MTPEWGTEEVLFDQMYDGTVLMFGDYRTPIISQSQPMTQNPVGQTIPAEVHNPHPEDLQNYYNELKRVDPNSITDIVTLPDTRFESLFWTYGITIRAYQNTLRHVVMVDDPFLKRRYPGMASLR
ncbi:hypothetical protein FRX31_011261, partial [Thalictrum thalictroides]